MKETSKIRKIAFVGDHLPRKCGIAMFTSGLLAAVAGRTRKANACGCSVNDIKATRIPTWFASRSRNRICRLMCRPRIFSTSASGRCAPPAFSFPVLFDAEFDAKGVAFKAKRYV